MSNQTGSPNDEILRIALSAAVPLWIAQMRNAPWEFIQERARVCSQFIAEHSDNILFKSKKRGDSAAAFNRFAEGVACGAFAPGGIEVFGMHFQATSTASGDSQNAPAAPRKE